MPIYAYRCEHCDFRQDVLQKMSDPLLVTCPSCGEPTFRKQVTAAGFQLKGSGWYVTDFRDQAKKESAKKPADGEAAGAKTETAGDDKPAAAGEAAATPPPASPAAAPVATPAPAPASGVAKSGSP